MVYNNELFYYSDDGEEYTGLRSGVIISSQIYNGSRSFLGNNSVILNFVHNVSMHKMKPFQNPLLCCQNTFVITQLLC